MSEEVDSILAIARERRETSGDGDLDSILSVARERRGTGPQVQSTDLVDRAKDWLSELAKPIGRGEQLTPEDIKTLATPIEKEGGKLIGPALEAGPGALIGGILGGVPGAAAGAATNLAFSGATGGIKGAIWGEPKKPLTERVKQGALDFSPTAAYIKEKIEGEPKTPPSWQETATEPNLAQLAAGPTKVPAITEEDKKALLSPRLDELPTGIQEGAVPREELERRREELYESPVTDILTALALTGGVGLIPRLATGIGRSVGRVGMKKRIALPAEGELAMGGDIASGHATAAQLAREEPMLGVQGKRPYSAPTATEQMRVPPEPMTQEMPAVKRPYEPPTVTEQMRVPPEEMLRPTQTLPAVEPPAAKAAEVPGRLTRTMEAAPAEQSVVSGVLPKSALPLAEETGGGKVGILRKGWGKFKSFWDPLISLPESKAYRQLRYETMGFLGKSEDFIEDIWKKTKALDPEQKKTIFEFLDGRKLLADLDPEVRPLANSLQRTNNMIGRALVNRGMLSQEVFEANKNKYIHRMYLKHVLGDEHPVVRGMSGGVLDLGELKARTLNDLEAQRAIGFIEDVSVAEPVGLAKSLKDIGMTDMMNKVVAKPEWVWPGTVVKFEGRQIGVGKLFKELEFQRRVVRQAPNVPEAQARLKTLEDLADTAKRAAEKVPEDFKQMPPSESFGPLASSFVRKEIYNDLVPMFLGFEHWKDTSKTLYYLAKANQKMMTAYKVTHTALNIPTGARNAVSSIIQINMSGIPIWEFPGWMMKTARSIRSGDQNYVLARRNGVFRTNFSVGELGEVIDTVRTMEGGNWNNIVRGAMKMTKWYGKIDDFFKLMKFIEQRSKGADVGKAVIEAQKWGMDYSLAHPIVKAARRNVMPFLSYQYKIYPLIAEAMVKRPWVLMKYQMVPHLMYKAARENLDLTEDDWVKLERDLPHFIKQSKTMAVLPIKSEEGRAQWVDFSYFLPWQQPLALAKDLSAGEYGEAFKDIGVGNPFLSMAAILLTKQKGHPPVDTFTKRPIYNELDTPTEKALAVSEWIYNQWTPPMIQRRGTVGKFLRIGEPDRAGTKMTAGKAAASLVGINITSPAPEAAEKERMAKLLQLNYSKAAALKQPGLSEGKRQQIWDEYRRQKQIIEETR